ncbi:MAG: hypothetical protein WC549_00270 [Actinomycetota bacterium]
MAAIAGFYQKINEVLTNGNPENYTGLANPPAEAKGKKTTQQGKGNGEEKVVKLITDFSKKRAGEIKDKVDRQGKEMEELDKKLKTIAKTKGQLEEKYKKLMQTKRSELVEEHRKLITQLKLNTLVEKIEVDTKKRLVVTTRLIKVKADKWLRAKELGVFQIRIDFSKSSFDQGIEILNITKRHDGGYDSPTINNTHPCWGNLKNDIDKEFKEKDYYELIVDLIDYISSPNIDAGYVKSWGDFFKHAKRQPDNYCFERYDQDEKGNKIGTMGEARLISISMSGVSTSPSVSTSTIQSTSDRLTSSSLEETFSSIGGGGGGGSYSVSNWLTSTLPPSNVRYDETRAELFDTFRGFGLTNFSSEHYLRLCMPEGERLIEEINLVVTRDHGEMYLARVGGQLDKVFLNRTDFETVSWEEFQRQMSGGSYRLRRILRARRIRSFITEAGTPALENNHETAF